MNNPWPSNDTNINSDNDVFVPQQVIPETVQFVGVKSGGVIDDDDDDVTGGGSHILIGTIATPCTFIWPGVVVLHVQVVIMFSSTYTSHRNMSTVGYFDW